MFVKICGITTVEDALLAAGLGADAVGMIFAASSRRVSRGEARDIVRRLPGEIVTVGVFRDERRERVVDIANSIGLRAVQLHGHETPEDTRWVADRVPIVIRAFAATDPALRHLDEFGKTWVLVDSATPGSGQAFDWLLLDELAVSRPFILAGGLNPGNVAEAVTAVQPWGIDVASGVEAVPGRKDPAKLRHFLSAARAVGGTFNRADGVAGSASDLARPVDEPPFNWEEDRSWR
jgi:phosphoribosylanthranilate isomerase